MAQIGIEIRLETLVVLTLQQILIIISIYSLIVITCIFLFLFYMNFSGLNT